MNLTGLAGVVAAAAITIRCSRGVPPSRVIDDPVLNCPSDLELRAHGGQKPTGSFDSPVTANGSPPITVACTPASGTAFDNGVTVVTCVATDSRAHKASCSFSVVVTPVPQLTKTTFLAFGDSLTVGTTTLVFRGAIVADPPPVFNTSVSYVEQLYSRLVTRYQDQSITIIADGIGGRFTGDDKDREREVLDHWRPDALLLLEGTNDMLNFPDVPGINSAAEALQRMVRDAKARGVRVSLATLPRINSHAPQPRNGTDLAAAEAAVQVLNERIRSIAAAENVTLVDLFAAIPDTVIGNDGVHLQASGYEIMADEWLRAIVETMEIKPLTLQ